LNVAKNVSVWRIFRTKQGNLLDRPYRRESRYTGAGEIHQQISAHRAKTRDAE
jgi:hypothetical protein